MRVKSLSFVAVLLVGSYATRARALDKQGSAHEGSVDSVHDGFDVSGALTLGTSLYNPSYAARPDNTGIALLRYAAHVDVDLVGPKLSIPLDVNMFTDNEAKGLKKLSPTELDLIGGLTTTWSVGPGAIEVGSRVEHDRPIDRGGFTQTYADVRARYLYSFAKLWPKLGDALADGDVTGWVTLGVFAVNPTYAARPDNTGKALFRFAPHVELSLFRDLVSIGLDATFFTDRESNILRPSELDLTPELIFHLAPFEAHLAYERDMPLDRGGLVQSYLYLLGVWSFDLHGLAERPLEDRGGVLSP